MKFLIGFAILAATVSAKAAVVKCEWKVPKENSAGEQRLSVETSINFAKAVTYEITETTNAKGKKVKVAEQLIDLDRSTEDVASALASTAVTTLDEARQIVVEYGANIFVYKNSEDYVVIAIKGKKKTIFSKLYSATTGYRVSAKCTGI